MMRFLLVKLLLLFLGIAPLQAQQLPEPMQPARLVNDFAQVMNQLERNKLEAMLVAYNDSTSTQITIVTIPSLEGYEVADYANRLYEKWGIGQKSKNNGLLILLSMQEKAVRLEVGYGLEDRLTDALSRRIIEREMVPRFRAGDFAGGLTAASKAAIEVLQGAYQADGKTNNDAPLGGGAVFFLLLIILVIILLNARGGGGQSFTGRGTRGYQPPFFFPMGGGGFGSGGGFGGGGGGFGGFGGGMSGGGGASGSW